MVGQEAAAVLLRKEAVEAPHGFLFGTDVEQFDDQQVAWFCSVDADRAGQEVDGGEIDVADVVGTIIVLI